MPLENTYRWKAYRKILLATDGSENAKSAACSGLEIAGSTGGEVFAVYVAGISCYSPIMPESYDWEIGREGSEVVTEIVKWGRKSALKQILSFFRGTPAQEILDFAEKTKLI